MATKIKSYEESLERVHRRAAGIYYTPQPIVTQMIEMAVKGVDLSDKLLLDPCCGSGNFLVEALRLGFRAENIYGFDTDPKGVKIARRRMMEITGEDHKKNIRVADFFDRAPKMRRRFDFVITNPPWGSYIEPKRRRELGRYYDAGHSVDSSSLMLWASLDVVREGGIIAFLLPESALNIGGFSDVRSKMLELRVTHLYDYGKPFKGLMTRAQAVVLRREPSKDEDIVECSYEGSRHTRTIGSFRGNPKGIMNFWLTQQEADVIDTIYRKPHKTLFDNANWGMGIVTGDNAKYCSDHPQTGYIGVVRGYDITEEGIGDPTTFIPSDLSQYQQIASREFYLAPQKILYRFISNDTIFRLDTEQRYILNSVNGFIPNKELGISCKRVEELLNSRVMKWLFRSIFRTHKVLRHDLEKLPLHGELEDWSEDNYLEYLGIEPTESGSYKLK